MWLIAVHHIHGIFGDDSVAGRCWVRSESHVLVSGLDRMCYLPQASRLCIRGRIGLVYSQSRYQGFNCFVNTNGKDNRNQHSAHESTSEPNDNDIYTICGLFRCNIVL